MYTHEIKSYLESRNYTLLPDEFYSIVKNSPQIKGYKIKERTDTHHCIHFYTSDNYWADVWFENYNNRRN